MDLTDKLSLCRTVVKQQTSQPRSQQSGPTQSCRSGPGQMRGKHFSQCLSRRTFCGRWPILPFCSSYAGTHTMLARYVMPPLIGVSTATCQC